ncbi:hypothetical protein WME76_46675 (plasmid) [Sorangium sp. So ce119]|uniref:hypothetical protein n=1 Tax=Sorangium sp. So ce119 TaxID=3133279 RepID=UPI003F6334C2
MSDPRTEDGSAILERVRPLAQMPWNSTLSPAQIEGIAAAGASLSPSQAISALEAWLELHAKLLSVRRGHAADAAVRLDDELGPLHPLHRELLTRFGGFLEVSIDPAYWPHLRNEDGFRVLGVSPEYPPCDVDANEEDFLGHLDERAEYGDVAVKEDALRRKAMVPMLTSLEGVADAWVSDGQTVEWEVEGRIRLAPHRSRDLPIHPRFGAPFALVAKLAALEVRLEEISRYKAAQRIVDEVEPTYIDGRQQLRLERDPSIALRLTEPTRGPVYVVLLADVAPVPKAGYSTDPLFARRKEETNRSVGGVVLYETTFDVLFARTEVLLEGMQPEDVRFALARLRHAVRVFSDPSLADFDAEPREIPAELQALLAAAKADRASLVERRSSPEQPYLWEVECVGREHPRIRWSYPALRTPHYPGHSHERIPEFLFPVHREGIDRYEVELPCATLTEPRIARVLSKLR